MKIRILFILLLLSAKASSQISIHGNLRNAKDTSKFDYWAGVEINIKDSVMEYKVGGSIERDEGKGYYSYYGSVNHTYGNIQVFTDTEKDIEFWSFALYYPVSIFRIGVEEIFTSNHELTCYVGLKHKYLAIDFSFYNKVKKLQYSLDPYREFGNIKLGLKIKGIYIDQKFKWNAGINLIINI